MPQNNHTTCNPAAIELLLADRLTDAERQAAEEHLDGCADCRGRLEQLAAEPGLWTEAREFLSSADEVPAPAESGSASASGHGAWPGDGEPDRSDHILSFLSATDDPRMLGRFGGYEIAGVIGHGGMGVVLKGLDVALNRYVAIKALAPHLATSAAARLRFAREARAAAAVVHENVIAIHAVSEANGLPYLVMPYIRGTSLQKRLDAQGRLAVTEILRIGMQAAAGLAAAHAQGLVHRDIKPGNILLEDGVERLTITDFGLARAADDASLTRSGVIAGTPQFMSPEQARGDSVDQRSDLFSLGSVLYTLCAGHAPFRAETSYGILRRISDDTPRPIREMSPDVPEWLCVLIDTLHAKKPAERYASAEDVARLFEQCLAHVQQPNVVPLPESLRTARPARLAKSQSRLVKGAIASGCMAIVAAAALLLKDRGSSDPSASPDANSSAAAAVESSEDREIHASASTRWNDNVERGIELLGQDTETAEQSFSKFWDASVNEPPSIR